VLVTRRCSRLSFRRLDGNLLVPIRQSIRLQDLRRSILHPATLSFVSALAAAMGGVLASRQATAMAEEPVNKSDDTKDASGAIDEVKQTQVELLEAHAARTKFDSLSAASRSQQENPAQGPQRSDFWPAITRVSRCGTDIGGEPWAAFP
jgi:hypothetical protein